MYPETQIMGVLNVTPDSFYDGGHYNAIDAARDHARDMARDGARWIDVGGESSRPGADPVGLEEELRRVVPVVHVLAREGLAVSVDTWRAETAREALIAGARMVNDITAFQGDPEMASVVADHDCLCVLMHMQGSPQTMQQAPRYNDVVDDICAFFEERVALATGAGVAEKNIWLDPGFGFGKTVAHNLELLRRLREFKRLGLPLLVGTSNKSTIGKVLDLPVDERSEGTAATVVAAIMNGADAVRVHDVRAMARVARMTDAILYGVSEDHA
jgi:dihydropteroate synthase